MEESMYTSFKSGFHFSNKPLLVVIVALLLLLSAVNIIAAAPCLDESDKIGIFLTKDFLNSGSYSGGHTSASYSGLDFGMSFPIGTGNVGFKSIVDNSSDYQFNEVFANSIVRENTLLDLSLEHLDSDGSILRIGGYRIFDNDNSYRAFFGPGISFLKAENKITYSIYFQGEINYHISEGLLLYGNGLYDFNLNTTQYELGVVFAY